MLKKLFKSLLIVVIFSYVNVFAASSCSYQEQAELNSEAANIKASYEVVKELVDPSSYTCYNPNGCEVYREYFKITILNLTENFYIEVQNSLNDGTLTLEYDEDTEETVFYWSKINDITTFSLDVITSLESGCAGKKYRTIRVTTPRKNPYSNHLRCNDEKNEEYCKEYVTFDEMSLKEFLNKTSDIVINNDENNTNNKTVISEILNFIKENALILSTGILAIIVVVGLIVINKRKRRVL